VRLVAVPAPSTLAIEAHRLIRAPADHIFNHLVPPDQMVRYGAPLWMVADAVEMRGAGQLVALRGYFIGLPAESLIRVTLRPPSSLEFVQVIGTLRAFSGRCTLRSDEDGVEVTYRLEIDPGIPMISDDAARQFLVQFLERMLDRVKLASERKSPSRRAAAKASILATPPGETASGDEEGADLPGADGAATGPVKSTREVEGTAAASRGAGARSARPRPAPQATARRRAERPPDGDASIVQAPESEGSQAAVAQPAGAAPTVPPSAKKRRRRRRGRRPGAGGTAPSKEPQGPPESP